MCWVEEAGRDGKAIYYCDGWLSEEQLEALRIDCEYHRVPLVEHPFIEDFVLLVVDPSTFNKALMNTASQVASELADSMFDDIIEYLSA